MRTVLFLNIGIALALAAPSAMAGDERCLVSFAGAQQDVCSGKVSLADTEMQALTQAELYKDSPIRLIKFSGPIDAQARAAVQGLGATILGYAPHYAYIVRMAPGQDARARSLPGVIWSGPFLPAFKIDPNIANELKNGNIVREAGIEELAISLFEGSSRSAVESRIARIAGLTITTSVEAGGDTRLLARFDRSQLRSAVDALARDAEVSAIGFRWPMRLLNSQADWLHQSNVNTPTPLRPVFAQGLYGCGQTVGVLDSGLHMANCAFNDPAQTPPVDACTTGATCPTIATPNTNHRKVISYYKWSGLAGTSPEDNHGHGTHVVGSIAGDNQGTGSGPVDCANFTTEGGNTDLDGTAPGAKIVMQEAGGNLAYLNTQGGNPYHAANTAYANGARLHSNSWGNRCTNIFGACIAGCTITYDAQTRDADNVARDNHDMVVLFAAGNDGSACPAGNNVGSPGNAKNVITVGATLRGTTANGMATFSSRGPANDARTKPDISAQGDSIISAGRNACGTASMSGTSMATPTTAGLAALVRDYLARGFYPSGLRNPGNAIANPSGALIKAILINGAATMSGSGAGAAPGQSQGWGRALLDNSLYFNGDSSRLYIHDAPNGLATGGLDVHTLNTTAGQALTVTLTWTDVAAAVNASPALVNSLRLEVVAPNGDVWTQKLPAGATVSNANPTQDITTANYDHLNNVHRIRIDAPVTGAYQVRVRGINVPTGPQKYALAANGNFSVTVDPDFALLTTPGSRTICAGATANFDIGVLSLGGFTAPVALSLSGLPGAATGSYTPATVTPASPAASSALAIANTAGVAGGSYSLVVSGASTSPAVNHSAGLTLNVDATAPAGPGLTAPADNANGQSTAPNFSWAAVSGASGYRIQIATDAAFTTVVENQTVSGTTFTPATALSPSLTYYWRVYAINSCGEGTASAVFRFTTANEICRNTVVAIPDANTTGVSDSQTVAASGTLSGLRLSVKLAHTYVGDLTLSLSKGATTVTFMQRPGNAANTGSAACSGNDMDVIVDDAAVQTLEANCTNTTSSPAFTAGAAYKGDSPFAAFAGQDLAGTWTLKAVDSIGTDTGELRSWCLLPMEDSGNDAIFDDGFEAATP